MRFKDSAKKYIRFFCLYYVCLIQNLPFNGIFLDLKVGMFIVLPLCFGVIYF